MHGIKVIAPVPACGAELRLDYAVCDPALDVTAEEWLALHHIAQRDDDANREITAADLTDDRDDVAREAGPETDLADLRERSVADPTEAVDAAARVPTVDETTAAVARAQIALAEIEARDIADAQREADDTWHDTREEAAEWNDDLVAER